MRVFFCGNRPLKLDLKALTLSLRIALGILSTDKGVSTVTQRGVIMINCIVGCG